jgi:hypothetical protein
MTLPNYFLTDLPAESPLSATLVTEACYTLRRNREKHLLPRDTQSMVTLLSRVARDWLDPRSPFRKLALEQSPTATGFSGQTLSRGLDDFFKQLTPENFATLLEQELGDAARLEGFIPPDSQRPAIALAPGLLAHIAAGNIPNPTLLSMVLGLLLRSAQFVKCATGSAFLPRLFAHSIYEADSKAGSCIEIAEWNSGEPRKNPGGPIRVDVEPAAKRNQELLKALFEQADCITATGSDEAISSIRRLALPRTRFVGYGHRVSFAYIAGGMLASATRRQTVERAGEDIIAWNQLGCLSPHAIYVEKTAGLAAQQFAELLANELERREQEEPRGNVPVEIAATISSRRSFYEIRAARCEDPQETRLWQSANSTAWTVVYEQDPIFQLSCLHRFVYVKEVKDLAETLRNVDSVRGRVSTVGLAATRDNVNSLALELARWGVSRVCPLGQMQKPPLTWRHDGRPPLGELINWTDLELE